VYDLEEDVQIQSITCRACKNTFAIPSSTCAERHTERRSRADEAATSPSSVGAVVPTRNEEREVSRRRPAEHSRDREEDPKDERPEGFFSRPRRIRKRSRPKRNLTPLLVAVAIAGVILITVIAGTVVYSYRDKSDGPTAANQPTAPSNPGTMAPANAGEGPTSADSGDGPAPIAGSNDQPGGIGPDSRPLPLEGAIRPAIPKGPLVPPGSEDRNIPAGPRIPTEPGPPAGPTGDLNARGDLVKLQGTWQTGRVKADGAGATGVIELQVTGSRRGRTGASLLVNVETKEGGKTSSARLSYTFTLTQRGENRALVATGPGGKNGVVFLYRLDGDELVITGKVALHRIVYSLENVSFRRTSASTPDLSEDD
jgi:hypothetical protein